MGNLSDADVLSSSLKATSQGPVFSYTTQTGLNLEDENKLLRETVHQLKEEVNKYRTPALMLADVVDLVDGKAVIKIPNGNKFLVEIANHVQNVNPGHSVLIEQKNLTVVDKIETNTKFHVEKFVIVENPQLPWNQVGGLSSQILEIKEVIELPLTKPELFKKVGITPPKGILLYGPPGTGKTLLAKAVASSAHCTFIEIVASELVQKFIGEGAKLVKEIFELARAKAPSIVFIDELDALAARRVELGTSGEREVQRTFMQLLAELDGFKPLDNVKIIGCTNRKDILDPAILRPGRLDRLIEVPNPNKEGLLEIFKIHSNAMRFQTGFTINKFIDQLQECSGAEIKAMCTEAGYFAIRENRTTIQEQDIRKAIRKVKKEEKHSEDYLRMFG
ncbi:MAG TPA: AAA family ATPase [Candidatus Nanoarchaeia archaeon]|nr:AAA family ATPase [Candidatus Nanoarchaeia archaeon]